MWRQFGVKTRQFCATVNQLTGLYMIRAWASNELGVLSPCNFYYIKFTKLDYLLFGN